MTLKQHNTFICAALIFAVIFCGFACHREPKPAATAAVPSRSPGEQVYRSQGCAACHATRTAGTTDGPGPNLNGVGTRRTREWIETQIKNPKSHNPHSVMLPYSKLSAKDIEDLVAYLAELK